METVSSETSQVSTNGQRQLISALNKHGFFFQAACENAIRQAKDWEWEPIHPLVPLLYNGVIGSGGGELDLRARLPHQGKLITLLGECKRQDPVLKQWVFLQAIHSQNQPKSRPDLRQIWIERRAQERSTGQTIYLPYPQIGISTISTWELPIAEEGRGICRDKPGGQSYVPKNDDVQQAAMQITEALHSTLLEECNLVEARGNEGDSSGYTHQYFLPIIITNADIGLCRYKPEDVDPVTGALATATFTREAFIIYQKSVPRRLLGFVENGRYANAADYRNRQAQYNRLGIFVVQGQRFLEFLDYVAAKISDIIPA